MTHPSQQEADVIKLRLAALWPTQHPTPTGALSKPLVVIPRSSRGLRARTLSEVSQEQLKWLWKPYLSLNSVALLDGREGIGKSTLVADLAARLSQGHPMPDGSTSGFSSPIKVLVVNREDDIATTRARVDAAGGNLDLVNTVDDFHWSIPDNMKPLLSLIREHQIQFLFLDPFFSMLSNGVNPLSYVDAQRTMNNLAHELRRLNCGALCVRHITKSGKGDAVSRGQGAVSFGSSVRSVLFMGRDPTCEDGPDRVFAQSKSNLGPLAQSLAFRFVEDPGLKVARINWTGASRYTANELVRDDFGGDDRTMFNRVIDLLPTLMKDEPMACQKVEQSCRECLGTVGPKTIQRAARDLKLKVINSPHFPPVRYYALPDIEQSSVDTFLAELADVHTESRDIPRNCLENAIHTDGLDRNSHLSRLSGTEERIEDPK